MVEGQCKCGSRTHLRTSNECPYNKSKWCSHSTLPHKEDDASPPHSDLSDNNLSSADHDNYSSDERESTSSDDWCYEDDVISSDVCGALGWAHKRCPMSSRNTLPTEVCSIDFRLSRCDSLWGVVCKSKSNFSTSGKRKSQEHPIKKERVTTSLGVGDYVWLLVRGHVPCRIVRKCRKGYQTYCRRGIH